MRWESEQIENGLVRSFTPQAISWHGSAFVVLACLACGAAGEPRRQTVEGDSLQAVAELWLRGKLACPCGGAGDVLSMRARPAGMPEHLLASWRWADLAEAPEP